MFGSCVFNKFFAFLICFFIGVSSVWAQVQKGTVFVEGAMVYQDPDFDSPVIDTLKRGSIFDISAKPKGPFYKIRLKPGMLGWISDTDIKVGSIKLVDPKNRKDDLAPEKEKKSKSGKRFSSARYRGPTLEFVNFTENTMGMDRTGAMTFFGVKFNGEDTMFDGDIYTDCNIIFSSGAPGYYSRLTRKTADGFVFMANFLFQTNLPQSKRHYLFYGFGPMMKFSHFNLEVASGAGTLKYAAEDLAIGALFNIGVAFKILNQSLRTDFKYFWERSSYTGVGINLGWEF